MRLIPDPTSMLVKRQETAALLTTPAELRRLADRMESMTHGMFGPADRTAHVASVTEGGITFAIRIVRDDAEMSREAGREEGG